jgi:NAD(P)H-quinone oxidoreductase subunit 4
LGVINFIYGALSAFSQDNLKRRLGYYSISHMGFVLVGIASVTELGINAAVLQMISHGLIAAMLSSFFPVPSFFFPRTDSGLN